MSSEAALTRNAGDPEQVKKAKQTEKRIREQELNDLRWILSQPQGRRHVWRLLEFCGVFKNSFTGNSTTFYNEGMRNVGTKQLADLMEANPRAFLEMMEENIKEKEKQETSNVNTRPE